MQKKRKIVTRKNANIMFVITAVFAVTFMLAMIVDLFMKKTLGVMGELAYIILGMLFLVCALIEIGLQVVCWFQGVYAHVTKYQGVKCFEEIDSYIQNLGEENSYYCSVIYEMNEIYKRDTEIERLTREKNLETLYARKSYLENNLDFYSNMVQVVTALGVSAVVAFAQVGLEDEGMPPILIVIGVIGLLLCITLKYVEKGRGDSYIYNLYEYELELLNKKIQSINEQLQANEDTQKILQLRHAVINMLVNLYSDRRALKKLGWNKKLIEKMYTGLNSAPLLKELEEENIIFGRKNICGSQIYFPLKIEGGEYRYLNENYERMYEILQQVSDDVGKENISFGA